MSLKARLTALERRLAPVRRGPPEVVVDVESFPEGPDAPLDSPVRLILRDPKGRTRVIGSLREFYRITAYPEGYKL